jgi:hypothetical protein
MVLHGLTPGSWQTALLVTVVWRSEGAVTILAVGSQCLCADRLASRGHRDATSKRNSLNSLNVLIPACISRIAHAVFSGRGCD